MAFPIFKLLVFGYRILSRPLNNLIVRTIQSRGKESNFRVFFAWFGQRCHIYEIKVNRYIIKEENKKNDLNAQEDSEIKQYIKPLSKEQAFNKGVEYFSEIFFFYAILLSLAFWEVKKNYEYQQQVKEKIESNLKLYGIHQQQISQMQNDVEKSKEAKIYNYQQLEELKQQLNSLQTLEIKSKKLEQEIEVLSNLINKNQQRTGIMRAIGNTPLIEIESLSKATGCRILAKCEQQNPGGSVKDRAALWIIEDAEKLGLINNETTIYEASGGNTGIALAMIGAAKGIKVVITVPKGVAQEKIDLLQSYGARVVECPPVPFSDENHYFHSAARLAREDKNSFFTNQFDNESNYRSHFEGTAPEIWIQSGNKIDAFVCSTGTGGTLSGISQYLKKVNPSTLIYAADPQCSGIFDYVRTGDHAEMQEIHKYQTRLIKRSAGSSMAEGIGIDRITNNFDKAEIDGAIQIPDIEAVEMAHHLRQYDGINIGPSAAINVVAAVRLAKKLGPGKTVCTIICDGGDRYKSKFQNIEFLKQNGLSPTKYLEGKQLSFLQDQNNEAEHFKISSVKNQL